MKITLNGRPGAVVRHGAVFGTVSGKHYTCHWSWARRLLYRAGFSRCAVRIGESGSVTVRLKLVVKQETVAGLVS